MLCLHGHYFWKGYQIPVVVDNNKQNRACYLDHIQDLLIEKLAWLGYHQLSY